jgi:hypothetical protein
MTGIAGGCGAGPLVPPAGEGPEPDVAPGGAAAPALECQACGHLAHADTNAATNILRAGRAQQHPAA